DSGVTRAPGALLWTWIQVGRLQRRLCPRQRPIRNGPRLEIFMNRLQNSLLADARVHAVTVSKWSNDHGLSLWPSGRSSVAPAAATRCVDGISASPPPSAARIGLPILGWQSAAA